MRRPKTLIAMGLIQIAIFGGLMLRGLEGPDAWRAVAGGSIPAGSPERVALAPAPAERTQPAALAVARLGGPCGPTSDALRCRSGD